MRSGVATSAFRRGDERVPGFATGVDDGGSRWTCVASLVETCKLNGVDPQRYFTDLLTRLVNGWPRSRIDELMPWHWAPAKNA